MQDGSESYIETALKKRAIGRISLNKLASMYI
jgi:hypothetical protein